MINRFSGYIKNILVEFEFNYGVNIVDGASGSGKSFLFKLINGLNSIEPNNDFVLVNYRNANHLDVLDVVKKHSMVILDNADLYMTEEILEQLFLISTDKIIITNLRWFIARDDVAYTRYIVRYDGREIKAIEL